MKKLFSFISLGLIGVGCWHLFNILPFNDSWRYVEDKDEMTGKIERGLYGKINDSKIIGLECNQQRITFSYLQKADSNTDSGDDFGPMYFKAGDGEPLKLDFAYWTKHDDLVGTRLNSASHEDDIRKLLLFLQGEERDIKIGFRGQKITDNSQIASSGLTTSFNQFLNGCNIRLDKWHDPDYSISNQ